MRRAAAVCLVVLLTGCSPWSRVKNAGTMEEARRRLGGYTPTVTPYPPNAEAWYFGTRECVLFVDGKVYFSQSTASDYEGGGEKHDNVICSPSEADDPVLKPVSKPVKGR